jgi:hypothetical protein
MKFRKGFVSNSSSSSFVCCITGEIESGMDVSYEDMGFAACCHGHEFMRDFLIKDAEDVDYDDIDESEVPEECCPICSFKELAREDVIAYLYYKLKMTKKEIEKEIFEKFSSFNEFQQAIEGIKI